MYPRFVVMRMTAFSLSLTFPFLRPLVEAAGASLCVAHRRVRLSSCCFDLCSLFPLRVAPCSKLSIAYHDAL